MQFYEGNPNVTLIIHWFSSVLGRAQIYNTLE